MEEIKGEALFFIYSADDGGYLAVRDISPRLCLKGRTIEEASRKARDALNFHKRMAHQ